MAKSEFKESRDVDKVLEQLPIQLRGRTLKKAVGKGCNVVKKKAKELAPKGDPKHKPERKALAKTIIVKTKQYRGGEIHMGLVGPSYPEGAHGHLNEEGHDVIVSRGERKGQKPLRGTARVEGKEFVAPAIDTTMDEQEKAVFETIQKDIVKAGG